MVNPRLPDFVGIGALKSATTYLDALLRGHPQLCLPAHLKEVQFFSRHYDRGPEWYASLFSSCDGRRRGEISPQYLTDERCPARIAALLPEVKLLVSIRDPVQRAYSQFKHWVEERGYGQPFESFLVDHPTALARGEYFRWISRYLDHFPLERVHVLLTEELVARPAPVLRDVFAFLDVDPHVGPPPAARPQNVSAVPRFHRLYVPAKRVTRWLYRQGGAGLVDAAKRLGVPRLFNSGPGGRGFAPLTPTTAARLREHYATDVARLSGLLGRDLGGLWWREPQQADPTDVLRRERRGS